jgi:hypothetical protein
MRPVRAVLLAFLLPLAGSSPAAADHTSMGCDAPAPLDNACEDPDTTIATAHADLVVGILGFVGEVKLTLKQQPFGNRWVMECWSLGLPQGQGVFFHCDDPYGLLLPGFPTTLKCEADPLEPEHYPVEPPEDIEEYDQPLGVFGCSVTWLH